MLFKFIDWKTFVYDNSSRLMNLIVILREQLFILSALWCVTGLVWCFIVRGSGVPLWSNNKDD